MRTASERPGPALVVRRLREAARNPGAAAFKVALRIGSDRLARLVTARPVTFNQKVRYKMVRDRRAILADYADKARVKRHIARAVGERYVVPTFVEYERADEIRLDELPEAFAIKVSHASGGVVLVGPGAPGDARLPLPGGRHTRHRIRRERFDEARARAVFASWLERAYGVDKGEWAYGVHPPRVLVEPLLKPTDGAPSRDVKFFVFHGRCAVFRIDVPQGRSKTLDHFRRDGTPLPVHFGEYQHDPYPRADPLPYLPAQLDEMVAVAERLGGPEDFLRVDVLDLGDHFVVGELTNYPTNGTGRFLPASFDRWLGTHWTVPERYE